MSESIPHLRRSCFRRSPSRSLSREPRSPSKASRSASTENTSRPASAPRVWLSSPRVSSSARMAPASPTRRSTSHPTSWESRWASCRGTIVNLYLDWAIANNELLPQSSYEIKRAEGSLMNWSNSKLSEISNGPLGSATAPPGAQL